MRSAYPAASRSGTYAASSDKSATSRTVSMIGLAGKPGTDVDPTCSSATTRSPRASFTRLASRA